MPQPSSDLDALVRIVTSAAERVATAERAMPHGGLPDDAVEGFKTCTAAQLNLLLGPPSTIPALLAPSQLDALHDCVGRIGAIGARVGIQAEIERRLEHRIPRATA